jgi:drug/metabolite transporter (DMT)-like permease
VPLDPLLAVLASAFLHALWNALLKRERETRVATVGVLAVSMLTALAIMPFDSRPAFADPLALGWALGSGGFEALYFVTLGLALERAPLGVAYTIARGGAIVAVWPISILWLGEPVDAPGVLALVAIALGLGATSWPQRGTAVAGGGSGLVFAALCAVSIAGYHVCYKCSLARGASPAALYATSLEEALAANLAALGPPRQRRRADVTRARGPILAFAGAVCSASFLVFLGALAGGGAGAVLTLRNTSVLFAQAMGWRLGERPDARRLIGAGLVVLGAGLLGWPR